LQEAKSRFSDLVNTVLTEGAQTVTKHGKPAVVVISAEEYQQKIAPRKSLSAAQAVEHKLIVVTRNTADFPPDIKTYNPWLS
jgi:prevent-host-death family protein